MKTRVERRHTDEHCEYLPERSDVVYPVDKVFSIETEDERNVRHLYVVKNFLNDESFTSRLKKYDQGKLVNYIAERLQKNYYDDKFINRCSWFLHMLELTDDRSLEYCIDQYTSAIID